MNNNLFLIKSKNLAQMMLLTYLLILGSGFNIQSILLNRIQIGSFICGTKDCDSTFIDYIENKQTYIIDKYQSNNYIVPFSVNPGLATFVKNSDQVSPMYFISKEDVEHTEMNFLKSIILDELNMAKTTSTLFNSLHHENVEDKVRGNFYIYTFLGPCQNCMSQYLSIAKAFKNIVIHVYYSEAFFENSLGQYEDYYIKDLEKSFPFCNREIEIMKKKIMRNRNVYSQPIQNYIYRTKKKLDFELINDTNNCIFEKYRLKKIFANGRVTFQRVQLNAFMKDMYKKMNNFNELIN